MHIATDILICLLQTRVVAPWQEAWRAFRSSRRTRGGPADDADFVYRTPDHPRVTGGVSSGRDRGAFLFACKSR